MICSIDTCEKTILARGHDDNCTIHPVSSLCPVTFKRFMSKILLDNSDNTIRGENSMLNPNKSSRFVGVSWMKHVNKWEAYAVENGEFDVI